MVERNIAKKYFYLLLKKKKKFLFIIKEKFSLKNILEKICPKKIFLIIFFYNFIYKKNYN